MKKIFKLFLIAIIVLVVVFISASIFISLKGKDIATAKLEEILKREVVIGDISVKFPLDLKITNLDIKNLLTSDAIYVSFGVIDLLRKNIELPGLKLVRPHFIIRKTQSKDSFFEGVQFSQRNNSGSEGYLILASSTKEIADESPISILIKKLVIKDGSIRFIDMTLSPDIFKLDINNINLEARGVSFPMRSRSVEFKLSALVLMGQDSEKSSAIEADGWIDFIKKDMQGNIEIANLDATHFRPYYRRFFSENLKSANLNFHSDLAAKDNNLTADCQLMIKDLLFEETQSDEIKSITFFDIIGASIAHKSRDINLNFVLNTKLDNPKIDSAQIRGMVLDKVLGSVTSQPPEQTAEDFEEIGEAFKEIGKELEDKFKKIFKEE